MLNKILPIDIDSSDPFSNDKLGRRNDIEFLTKIIDRTHQPFTLSVNGAWGTGKTTFIKMWDNFLKEQGFTTISFNAWEHDFTDDPLVALIAELGNTVDSLATNASSHPSRTEAWDKVKTIGGALLRVTAPIALRSATQGAIELDDIKSFMSEVAKGKIASSIQSLAEDRLEAFTQEKNAMTIFRNSLSELVTTLSISDNPDLHPIIFFIDELDRCRPLYAVQLLERLKHLFSVPGLVFILAWDRNQLSHSVRAEYGSGMDADGYLRRFIDLEFNLPYPDPEVYSHILWELFGFDTLMSNRQDGSFDKKGILESYIAVQRLFNLSLRDQEQCFIKFDIILRSTQHNNKLAPYALGFLVGLLLARPDIYYNYCSGKLYAKDVLTEIEQCTGGKEFLESNTGFIINAYLSCWSSDDPEGRKLYKIHSDIADHNSGSPSIEKKFSNKLIRALGHVYTREEESLFQYIRDKIELTTKFQSR